MQNQNVNQIVVLGTFKDLDRDAGACQLQSQNSLGEAISIWCLLEPDDVERVVAEGVGSYVVMGELTLAASPSDDATIRVRQILPIRKSAISTDGLRFVGEENANRDVPTGKFPGDT